jgi:hypothetical protein
MNMKLPTSFFLCLIGTLLLSLSACAQPMPTEQEKPSDQKLVVVKPEPMANEPSSPQKNSSNKDMTSMIDLDNPPRGPAIPAAELKQQILSLVASLASREDTNQTNVEKYLKVKMHVDPEWDRNRMYWGKTIEGWSYWFSVTSVRNEPASTIEFHLFHGEDSPEDSLLKVCTLEFEPLAKELIALGYKRGSEGTAFFSYGNKRAGFSKGFPENNIGFGVGLYVYRADNGTEDGNLCVTTIRIGHEMKP